MQAQVLCDSYLNLLPTLKQDVCIHLAAADDGLAVESRAYKTGRRCGRAAGPVCCIHLAAADDGLTVESRAYTTGRRCGQGPKKVAEPQGTQEHSSSRFEGIYKTPLCSPYVILQT